MTRGVRRVLAAAGCGCLLAVSAQAQTGSAALTWDQVKAKFEADNPTLKADQSNVDEMKAEEITADLRPNPQFGVTADGTQIAPNKGVWEPLAGTFVVPSVSYLHERDHKRELRLKSAQEGTQIAGSEHEDLERTMLFSLRGAFVQVLESKAIVDLSKQELDYYDHIIDISHERFKKGDLAEIDFERIDLERVQYESDLQAAEVNLRTAKIQLLQLLDDKTPIDSFDVQGPFDFSNQLQPLDSFHQIALDNRPDLRAAVQSVQQADTNHKLAIANGSTDPTFGAWYTWNSSTNNPEANDSQTLGLSVNVPLRIFDRNQGEKLRTQIDIARNQQQADATRAQVFSDVDSAYALVSSNLTLLRPYHDKYLAEALKVRDTVTYAWQHGGASLMDFLNAQSDYRNVQMAYLQLVGAWMTAAAQLNMAVGHEVIQ
ncbi:MAG TPA: TolC family protein [Acidobacteriaceae bacterium]|nr:TolC family protein [Acidobacteriaceae bacterium]